MELPRPSYSALSQTRRFLKNPFAMLAAAREECGPIFCLRVLGFGDWVFVCSPDLAKEMFTAPDTELAAGAVNHTFLGYLLGENSLFDMDGGPHRKRRRRIHPHVTGKHMLAHVGRIRRIAEEAVEQWPLGEPIPIMNHTDRIALEVILRAFLGDVEPDKFERFFSLTEKFFEKGLRSPLVFLKFLQLNLGRYSPWGRVLQMQRELFEAWGEEIEARANHPGAYEDSVLTRLMEPDPEDGSRLPKDALIHEMVTISFGAQEAPGKILAWAILGALSKPEVLARLRQELDSVLNGKPVAIEHLPALPYLDAVISEGIRYRPLGPMAGIRISKKETQLGGYAIPEGTLVSHCFSELSQDSERFPDPKNFDPDRFFERKIEPYRFSPFGGGTRMCIGKKFAEMEMKVVLATIFQRAELEACQAEVEPVRRGLLFFPENANVRLVRRLGN